MWRILFLLTVWFYGPTIASVEAQPDAQKFFAKVRSSLDEGSRIWVLLAAGSSGWGNYRHQADVCHAYHVLMKHGIPADNIITMMVDDIANHSLNPFRGKIFNEPDGDDVYGGVKIDYKGDDVTPANFLAILSGRKNDVKGGNRRVIESTENDNIFVYFSDHGSSGAIVFPHELLTAERLNKVLKEMHSEKRYANLVFYLETCFSGSMFNNLLPEDINVYALTAANPYHSSYACFCEEGFAKGLHCLGDCFSYAWISDSTWSDPKSETLQEQYEIVKEETTSSIVSRYGQMSIREKPIAEFQGPKPINPPIFNVVSGDTTFFTKTRWPSDDVPIMYADYQLRRLERMNASPQLWIRKSVELRNMKTKRSFVDDFMQYFVKGLVHDSKLAEGIITNRETPITKFDCHEAVVTQFMTQCFRISEDPYVLSKLYVLVNLCESGIDAHRIIDHMKLSCPYVNVHGIV